jgi:ubiquitin-protein ligase E3 A
MYASMRNNTNVSHRPQHPPVPLLPPHLPPTPPPPGAAIPVTDANRHEYVRAYARWMLCDSVASQFQAFRRGFIRVCGGPALSMFTPGELELLVCGLQHLDFDELERVARCEGGYSR